MAKYKAYPEYKDSEVESFDTIPKTWSIKKLKYIFEIKKKIAGKLGFNVLSVTQKGIKIKDIESGEGQLSMDYSKYQRVYPGEFAMNHMDLLTGYVDISNYDGVTSPDYRVFAVRDKNSFYSRYYLYLLQDGYKQRRFFHLGQGSAHLGRWRLPTEAFNEIVYPCPSLKEQTQIASFLDHETAKIDNLIEKQQQLIELLKEKRQAVISHAVTKGLNPDVPMKDSGVEWLGEVPAHWTVTRLGYHAIKIGSGKTPRGGSEIYLDEGVLFLRSQNIYDDGLRVGSSECVFIDIKTHNEMNGTRVLEGDILLNITGGSIGRSCIVPTPFVEANVNQHVCILRFTENIREFISYAMKSSSTKEQIEACQVGGNREGLNFEQTSKINICLPPEEDIGAVLGYLKIRLPQLYTLEKNAENIILLLQERRTALISAAVTGKIDVRDWVAPDTQDTEEPQEATA